MHDDAGRLATTWLQTARGDLHVARLLVEEMPAAACFNAQQAAEKALKAILVALCGDAPRKHALRDLLEELDALHKDVPDDLREHAKLLDQYYMPTRYPDALGDINPHSIYGAKQSADAYAAAEAIVNWSDRQVDEM